MMGDPTVYRLEHEGTVVAYLSPRARCTEVDAVRTFTQARPNGSTARVRQRRQILTEVNVQWRFVDSNAIGGDVSMNHRGLLETLFGGPATALDQANRLRHYVRAFDGPFDLYADGNEYRFTTEALIDEENGAYAGAWLQELRFERNPGTGFIEASLKIAIGLTAAG